MSTTLNDANDNIYTVSLPYFEGPLDLLLQLIEKAALDITQLSLAQVTDQFLHYIKFIQNLSANEISSFVVIASKLIQIKSIALLPKSSTQLEQDETVGETLVRQLIEYKKFKTISKHLADKENLGFKTYLRMITPFRFEQNLDLSYITINDLALSAYHVFCQQNSNALITQTLSSPRVTIRQKVNLIIKKLDYYPTIGFWSLFVNNKEKLDIVITFLALLELIKQNLVTVHQDTLFDEITISKNDSFNLEKDLEIEFDE